MKNFLLSMMLVLGATSFGQLYAQALDENFNQGIPGTWKLYDVDGRTPDADVAFVTAAWVSNFSGTDTFVTSTSWYNPVGAADDWLVSPPVVLTTGDILSWRGKAQDPNYPDGYEVRISVAGDTVPDFLANAAIFSVAAESASWTNHFIDLEALGYTNQTVYIAFRNNSNNEYLLHIDDVLVNNVKVADGAVNNEWIIDYTQIPLKQVKDYSFAPEVSNVGTDTLKNAFVTLQIYNYYASQLLYSQNTDTLSLLPGETDTLSYTQTWQPTDTGTYVFVYLLSSDNDGNAVNDTLVDFVFVTDTVYSRVGGNAVTTFSFLPSQAVNGGLFGLSYEIETPVALTSVDAEFFTPVAGDSTAISVYRIVNRLPELTPIATSNTYIFAGDTFPLVTFTFPDLVVLQPDTYVIALSQNSGRLSLVGYEQKLSSFTHWLYLDAIDPTTWFPFEFITGIPQRTPYIDAHFGACPVTIDTAYVQQPSCPDALDGVVLVEATANYGALSYEWSNGDNDSIAEFLTGQTYTVTIEDGIGCQTVANYNLAVVAPITISVSVTNASTATSNDGAANATVTGGTAPYTYEWSVDSTSASVSGLAAGTVSVTVTDANGCDEVATATVGSGVGIFTPANNLVAKVYPNPAANQVSVELTLDQTSNVNIAVLNNLGQVVLTQTESNVQVMNTSLNISTLPAGIYLIQISSDNASTTQKLIVE